MKLFMVREAWISIAAHKLRSFLTILGIVIGVGAVVVMVAAGQTAERFIQGKLEAMGNNLFIVVPGSSRAGGVRGGLGSIMSLTTEDADGIAELSGVVQTAPVVRGSGQMVNGTRNWNAQFIGTTPDYLEIGNWTLESGSSFTEQEVRNITSAVILGSTTVKNLFGGDPPIGKVIRIQNAPFTVIGVLAPKGQSLDGRDQDDVAIMPITTLRQKITSNFFRNRIDMIMVKTVADRPMESVEPTIRALLRERHRLKPQDPDDFMIRNLTSLANTITSVSSAMSGLLAAIASISLLVGSIGIMNMMLVSVAERTREIGIRKAIGAPNSAIMQQFLLEAMVLSFIGSLFGMAIGFGITLIGGWILGYDVVISVLPVMITLMVAAVVGIASGFFPALKATRLDPIEALRYQ